MVVEWRDIKYYWSSDIGVEVIVRLAMSSVTAKRPTPKQTVCEWAMEWLVCLR
jgi:hypothetical protein